MKRREERPDTGETQQAKIEAEPRKSTADSRMKGGTKKAEQYR